MKGLSLNVASSAVLGVTVGFLAFVVGFSAASEALAVAIVVGVAPVLVASVLGVRGRRLLVCALVAVLAAAGALLLGAQGYDS